MPKPIYLPQDLCTKLQSKGLECGSGRYWREIPVFGTDEEDDSMAENPNYFDDRELIDFPAPDTTPAFELHIDILGSRENLTRLFTDECYHCPLRDHSIHLPKYFPKAIDMLRFILDGNPDQAINLIKEAL